MDHLEELRRIVRGYRQSAPHGTPPALLEAIKKLDVELGPGQNQHLPIGGVTLEQELRDAAAKLIRKGAPLSGVASGLLKGVVDELNTPGRAAVIDAQPNAAGQLPEPEGAGSFPDPQ